MASSTNESPTMPIVQSEQGFIIPEHIEKSHKVDMGTLENYSQPPSGPYQPLKQDGYGHEKPWTPGPRGLEPKLLQPPRYELRELQEKVMFLDYDEQENCTGVASQLTRTYGHRFWGEFFAVLMPILDFVFALVLEAFGFVLKAVVHLVVGILVRVSDLFFKPLLTVLYNAFTIPSLTHAHSVLNAVIRMIDPAISLAERLVQMAVQPIAAFRLVELKKIKNHGKTFSV